MVKTTSQAAGTQILNFPVLDPRYKKCYPQEYDASTGSNLGVPSTDFPPLPAPKRSLSQLEISAELDSSLKTPVKGIKRQNISLDEDEALSKRSRESDVR